MGLICNGYRNGHTPFKFNGSLTTIYNGVSYRNAVLPGRVRNITAGEGLSSDYVGVPSGYYHPGTWIMPQKPGRLSSRNEALGISEATLTMVMGINIAGVAAGVSSASASLQLVISLSGNAAGVASVYGLLMAILELSGSASGTSEAEAATSAIAWCIGSSQGDAEAVLGSYAIAHLSGSITPYTELSPQSLSDAVWKALAVMQQDEGTMGELLNSAGAAADPLLGLVEGSMTLRDSMRIIYAVLAGISNGSGTGEITFRDLADTRDRVTAIIDANNNRTAVTVDAA